MHLVDLDGDGHLDLFLSSHANADAIALLNDGHGAFALALGNWPPTEVHLAYDTDEDGKIDLSMTYVDGGGQWWRNLSSAGTLAFSGTAITRDGNTARVRPVGLAGIRGAAGAKIRLFAPATRQLVGYQEVAIYDFQAAPSYYGRAKTERHFGLGDRTGVEPKSNFIRPVGSCAPPMPPRHRDSRRGRSDFCERL